MQDVPKGSEEKKSRGENGQRKIKGRGEGQCNSSIGEGQHKGSRTEEGLFSIAPPVIAIEARSDRENTRWNQGDDANASGHHWGADSRDGGPCGEGPELGKEHLRRAEPRDVCSMGVENVAPDSPPASPQPRRQPCPMVPCGTPVRGLPVGRMRPSGRPAAPYRARLA